MISAVRRIGFRTAFSVTKSVTLGALRRYFFMQITGLYKNSSVLLDKSGI